MARPLINIRQLQYADMLASYLTSQGINVHVEANQTTSEYTLYLKQDDDYDAALTICRAFVAAPHDAKYQQAAWQHSTRTDLNTHTQFTGINRKRWLVWLRRAPFCGALLCICTVLYVLSVLGLSQTLAKYLMIQPFGQLVANQQWWRLLGPAVIHFSLLHIVFNLLWWGSLGGRVEHKFGSSFLFVLFIVTALTSNIAQLLVAGPNFGGLSGVVYGLLGFVWITGWLRPEWGMTLPTPVVGFMLLWLILGYTNVLWINMANTAHTAGLLSGVLIAWLLQMGTGLPSSKNSV